MADTTVAIDSSVHHTSAVACRCRDEHQSSEFICADFCQSLVGIMLVLLVVLISATIDSSFPAATVWAAGCDWNITGNDCESYFVCIGLSTLEIVGNLSSFFFLLLLLIFLSLLFLPSGTHHSIAQFRSSLKYSIPASFYLDHTLKSKVASQTNK